MKVGIETILFGPRINDLALVLDMVSYAGYEGVEFSQRPEMLQVRENGRSLPVTATQLQQLLAERHLTFLGLAGGTLTERISFCTETTALQPEYLYVEDCVPSELHDASQAGFRLALHPHVFMKNARLDDAMQLLQKLDLSDEERLYWMPDTAHQYIVGDNIVNSLRQVPREKLICIHLKDWDAAYGRSYHRYSKGFTELGRGDVPLTSFVAELLKMQYDGWIVVEQDYCRSAEWESLWANGEWLQKHYIALNNPRRMEKQAYTAWGNSHYIEHTPVEHPNLEVSLNLLEAGQQDLIGAYNTIVHALAILGEAEVATLWTYDPAREDVNLLACYPPSLVTGPHYIKKEGALASRSIDSHNVTVMDSHDTAWEKFAWRKQADAVGACCAIMLPVLNRFNHHHIRFLVGFLKKTPLAPEASQQFFDKFLPYGVELAAGADMSLDDVCAYAASRAGLLTVRSTSLSVFLKNLCVFIRDFVDCEGVSIFLVNSLNDRLEEGGTTGIQWNVPEGSRFYEAGGTHWTSKAWSQNQPLLLYDARYRTDTPLSEESGPHVAPKRVNLLLVPLVHLNGRVIGVVRCRNKRVNPFVADDAAIVDAIGQAVIPQILLFRDDEQRMRAVAKLTHELGIPMVAIRGCIDWMREDMKDMNAECMNFFTYDYLEDLDSWSRLMLAHIGNASLFGAKNVPLDLKPTLTRLRGDIIAPVKRQIRELFLEREFDPSAFWYSDLEEIPPLYIDKLSFYQVFFNLLSNAIKYAYNDPASFRINIDGRRRGNFFEITFRDWGPGIDSTYQEIIFEEGVRGPKSVQDYVAGQGLGLWIVRRIVKAHGGRIALTNTHDPTEFTIFLPVALQGSPPAKSNQISA